jgi:protein TonB
MNWPRIGALSGSLSMHLYILALLLTPPIAMQLLKHPVTDSFVIDVLPIKPKEVPLEPVLPTPVRHEMRPHATPHVTPTPPVTSSVESSIPIVAVDSISPVSIEASQTPIDIAPTALAYGTRTRVEYPREALIRREQGTVILRVLVGADGIPQTVEIETSSGSPRLDSAARDAVKHWSFRAGTRNGMAASAWARVPSAFNLSKL